MADDADRALADAEIYETNMNKKYDTSDPNTGYKIPEGKPGICDLCGEWSARLIDGACASCRDKYKLP